MSIEDGFYCIEVRVSLEDGFYCIDGVLSSECPLKMGFTVEVRLSLEDWFYCIFEHLDGQMEHTIQ